MTTALLLGLFGYLLGAIPTGLLVGKTVGVDPRLVGSGRVGATNTYRALGLSASILVAALDSAKGGVVALLGLRLHLGALELGAVVIATVLGQVYSVFLLAQGGRGVATTAGAAAVLWPAALPIAALAGIIAGRRSGIISVGSLFGALALPAAVGLVYRRWDALALAMLLAGLIFYSHRDNIRRLRDGTEAQVVGGRPSE
ncbi:MAG: glycerol-3-phosphate acyltransferase [Candidatus Dormibacteraeota bacterium]|nr:glycerol-3-phosphate acyltransferase [Candidatus Dormibacteraeota bacterium]